MVYLLSALDNQDKKRILLLTARRRAVFMTDQPSDLVQGTLDMLVLKTLALEPMHGYGIAVRIEQMRGVFRVRAGSLFVAFERLRRQGRIRSQWKATENARRAKYYLLTEQGRKRLNSETRQWGRQTTAIAKILEAS
jgi:transcriptional regulator